MTFANVQDKLSYHVMNFPTHKLLIGNSSNEIGDFVYTTAIRPDIYPRTIEIQIFSINCSCNILGHAISGSRATSHILHYAMS